MKVFENALLLCGRKKTEIFYQLLIGNRLNSTNYKVGTNYQNSLNNVCKEYANKILGTTLELGIWNGLILNPSGKKVQINKLNASEAESFSKKVVGELEKISTGRAFIINRGVLK
ncbi:MAG: hypothetical protein KJ949_00140 [Nanoarchaeota archaeon]|nr:hypothetical protein [Nanoarchaeota archaeon]